MLYATLFPPFDAIYQDNVMFYSHVLFTQNPRLRGTNFISQDAKLSYINCQMIEYKG